ncbi:MAG: RNA polymerase sigma factor [Solirubrobacteraceae bacterium]
MTDDVAMLVLRCREGDRGAESAVAQRASTRALQIAVVAMGDVHGARDVSQEVAVRVLRGIGALRAPDRFDAWVYRITASEIRRAYGRRRRRSEVSLDEHVEAASGPEAGAISTGDRLLIRAELRAAMMDLSVRERTVLALRYIHDLDDVQIARVMRCRAVTVRSLLSRARAKLSRHPALADPATPAAANRLRARIVGDPLA